MEHVYILSAQTYLHVLTERPQEHSKVPSLPNYRKQLLRSSGVWEGAFCLVGWLVSFESSVISLPELED